MFYSGIVLLKIYNFWKTFAKFIGLRSR